jgi:hypothetical protein
MDITRKLLRVLLFLVVLAAMGFVSCSKKTDNSEIENAEVVTIPDNDLHESDEDLHEVDYKEFYDELAPHGEWIEITDKDIELKMKKGSASGEAGHRKISLSDFFGVKDAYAYDGASFGAFFVWRPSPNLAVGLSVTDPEPTYVPYSNGQWIYTDAGWYFRAATPYEETVHHYGRWVYSPALGWIWVPGRVRAPAWVDWREDDSYIAWAPVPPSVYIVNNVIIVPPIYEERYIVVERRYFVEPFIYKYHHKGNKYRISEWHRPDGIVVVNNVVQNYGPDVIRIQNTIGSVKNMKDVKYSEKEISVYSPDFRKIKKEKNPGSSYTKPGKYESYSEYRGRNKELGDKTEKNDSDPLSNGKQNSPNDKMNKNNSYDKESKNKSSMKDDDKKDNGKFRIGDDSNMKDGKKDRDRNNDKGSKNKIDNNVKQKGSDNYDKGGNDKSKGNNKFRNEYNGNDRHKGSDKRKNIENQRNSDNQKGKK